MLSETAHSLLHGPTSLLLAYSAVEVPMLASLIRGRASLGKLAASPLLAVPLTMLSEVALSYAEPTLNFLGLAAQVTGGLAICAGVGYGAGRWVMRRAPTSSSMLRRGAIVLDEGAEPVRAAQHGISLSHEHARCGLTLAGLPVAAEDETKHFKLIGTTGTGKSTAISEILAGALARGDRAVIADPDGGYLRRFYDPKRGDVILNPFEPRSVKWNLFGEIDSDYDVEQLARSLIPDHEGADRSWRGYARTFFSAVTAQARAAGTREVSELYRLLVVAGSTELKTLVAGTPAQPFLEEHNGRMFDSIRSVTSSAVGALEYVARQSGTPFSVREWVRGQRDAHATPAAQAAGGVLFMPYRAGQIAALRSTISAWMRLAIFEAMNREGGGERLWFVVDELDALGQIDGLKDALARLRKFGGRCVLGFQSVAQVSSTYGGGEAQTIVENCGNSLILRCSASEHGGTSQFASRLIGQREVLRITTSRSQRSNEWLPTITRAEHLSVEPAVMASQIEQLADLSGYLKLASRPEWRRVRLEAAPHHLERTQSREHESAAEPEVVSAAEHLTVPAGKILSFRRTAPYATHAGRTHGARTDHEETSALRADMSAVRERAGTPAHDGFEPE
jgi:type IV secretory pathway TraG/TraD family ATPase VirD4